MAQQCVAFDTNRVGLNESLSPLGGRSAAHLFLRGPVGARQVLHLRFALGALLEAYHMFISDIHLPHSFISSFMYSFIMYLFIYLFDIYVFIYFFVNIYI